MDVANLMAVIDRDRESAKKHTRQTAARKRAQARRARAAERARIEKIRDARLSKAKEHLQSLRQSCIPLEIDFERKQKQNTAQRERVLPEVLAYKDRCKKRERQLRTGIPLGYGHNPNESQETVEDFFHRVIILEGSLLKLKILIEGSKDVPCKTVIHDVWRYTVLHLVARYDSTANADLFTYCLQTSLGSPAVMPRDIFTASFAIDGSGWNPLFWACWGGKHIIVLKLLKTVAEKHLLEHILNSVRDVNGASPLHIAAYCGNDKCCALLLAAGCDRKAVGVASPYTGKTPGECARGQALHNSVFRIAYSRTKGFLPVYKQYAIVKNFLAWQKDFQARLDCKAAARTGGENL